MKTGPMHMPVNSSTINTVGYNPDTQELHVKFHGSGTYVYHNVPEETHKAFMASDSKGKFLHNNIKGVHEHRKI